MKFIHIKRIRTAFIPILFFVSACSSPYNLASVEGSKMEMNSTWDSSPNAAATAVLESYKGKIDSIMSPVVGRSAVDMAPYRPESPLSNLVADVLRESVVQYSGKPADIGVINIGGLRNSLKKGEITYGDVFEILPFENSLCVVTLKGSTVKELMENIVLVRGEGISNVKLTVNDDKEIISCTVGGRPIDDNRLYTVATLDYLAEGNDKLVAFLKAEEKHCFPEATIRNIFLNYLQNLTKEGKEVTTPAGSRYTIQKKEQ